MVRTTLALSRASTLTNGSTPRVDIVVYESLKHTPWYLTTNGNITLRSGVAWTRVLSLHLLQQNFERIETPLTLRNKLNHRLKQPLLSLLSTFQIFLRPWTQLFPICPLPAIAFFWLQYLQSKSAQQFPTYLPSKFQVPSFKFQYWVALFKTKLTFGSK